MFIIPAEFNLEIKTKQLKRIYTVKIERIMFDHKKIKYNIYINEIQI